MATAVADRRAWSGCNASNDLGYVGDISSCGASIAVYNAIGSCVSIGTIRTI